MLLARADSMLYLLMHRFSKQRSAIAKSSKAWKYKLIALQAYGAVCVCCGETEPAFLTFDHIGGGGEQHRKADPLARKNIALWLIKHSFPGGFRLLCYNCHKAIDTGPRHLNGICPHQSHF